VAPKHPRAAERLHIVPVTLRDARAFVTERHRHLGAPAGGKLALAVADTRNRIRGVAILGRPVARKLDTRTTIEVTRVATDGCRNACSALYGAAARVARVLGYHRIQTYTLDIEPGTSLRAAGWLRDCITRGGAWSRARRRRGPSPQTGRKHRWKLDLRNPHTA
jgi:hypothetical protein